MEEKCALPQKKGWSNLIKNEDWLAVWIGFLIIAIVLIINNYKIIDLTKVAPNYKWAAEGQILSRVSKWNNAIEPLLKDAETKEETGAVNRLQALKNALAKGERKEIESTAGKVERIGGLPGQLGKEIGGHAKALPEKVFQWENLSIIVYIGIIYMVVATIGLKLMGGVSLAKFMVGFPFVFFLAWLSRFFAGNALPTDWGIEYVIFALIIGLFVSNVLRVPDWLTEAVRTEYYIKSGLVILGAGLLFFEILQAGALGIRVCDKKIGRDCLFVIFVI
jgi:hypothetical protein